MDRDPPHPTWISASLMSNADYYMPWFVQHQCNEWKWKFLSRWSYPANVLVVESTLEDYQAANTAVTNPDLSVLRHHLDQIIIKTRRSLHAHVDWAYAEWRKNHRILFAIPREIVHARYSLLPFDDMFA
jgi:hypothetical protein